MPRKKPDFRPPSQKAPWPRPSERSLHTRNYTSLEPLDYLARWRRPDMTLDEASICPDWYMAPWDVMKLRRMYGGKAVIQDILYSAQLQKAVRT